MAAVCTDLTRLKAWMGVTDTTIDGQLQTIIDGVDRAFETYLARPLVVTRRTEVIPRIRHLQRVVTMRTAPIATVISVRLDLTRVFTDTPMDASDYVVLAAEGQIYFDAPLPDGIGVLQVVYDAGMGADVTDLVTRYPDIHRLAQVQCQFEYQRRKTPGTTNEVAQGGTKTFSGPMKLLDAVIEGLTPYRRRRLD